MTEENRLVVGEESGKREKTQGRVSFHIEDTQDERTGFSRVDVDLRLVGAILSSGFTEEDLGLVGIHAFRAGQEALETRGCSMESTVAIAALIAR